MCERIKSAIEEELIQISLLLQDGCFRLRSIEGCIQRSKEYINAGADGIFLEAITSLQDYKELKEAIQKPILANITKFGILFSKIMN